MEQGSARNSHPVYQRMDWRINIARGFSVPEEKFHQMGSWITTTPEKPIPPRSNLMPIERHGDQLGQNWQEMVRLPGQFVPEASNFNGKRFAQQLGSVDILAPKHGRHGHTGTNANHFLGNDVALAEKHKMINHIASSCGPALHCAEGGRSYSSTHVLRVHNASAFPPPNRTHGNRLMAHVAAASLSSPNRTHESHLMAHVLGVHNDAPFPSPIRTHESSLGIANDPATPDLLTQDKGIQNNLRESLLTNHSDPSNSILLSSGHALSKSQNRIPIPHWPCYELHTQPRMEDNAPSCTMTSVMGAIDGNLSVRNQFPARANISAGKCSTDRKHSDIVLATANETHQQLFDELLHNIVDCSSAVVSGSSEKTEVLEVGGNTEDIDLNKTPIKKPPKRRKHRPKVIAEGKTKRAAKVVTPKTTTSEEKPTRKRKYVQKYTKELPCENADKPIGKRKYVRKKIGESATPNADSIETTTNFSTEIAVKSCRRALNFDLGVMENERQGSSEAQKMQLLHQKEMAVNFNVDPISAKSSYRGNEMPSTTSASKINQSSQWNQLQEGNQRQAVSSSHIHSTNQRRSNIIDLSEEQAEGLPANTQHIKMEDLTVNRRDTQTRIQQCFHAEGLGQTSSPAKTNFKTIEMTRQMRNSPPSVAGITSYTTEDWGMKRQHHQNDHLSLYNLISMGLSTKQRNDFCQSGRVAGLIGPEISQNKHRNENGLHPQTVYPFCANGYSRPEPSANKASSVGPMLQYPYETDANKTIKKTDKIGVSSINHIDSMATGNTLSQSLFSLEPHSGAARKRKTSAMRNSANFSSLTTAENKSQQTPQTNTAFRDQLQSRTDQSAKSKQWKKKMSAQSSSVPCQEVKMVKQNRDAQDCQPPSATSRGQQANKNYSSPIEEITQQLEVLRLNERTIEVDDKEQNALVPYRGDGVIVPYEGFDFIKKRKPRPKVDLDTETERVWKLLMGKEGSEGLEETDKEKEKWWEEERRVFQGRANSFIARMHLVQGDRRFSKWKGSVVDSVIGVFLTQNVSDHLSSSAFMSLAARFPLKSPESNTFNKELTCIVPEQDISKQTRETIKWIEELLTSSHPDESSLTLNESGTDSKDYETWIDRSFYTEVHGHNLEEEFISSQDSSDSLIYQPIGAMGTCSAFNQEAEDLASDFKPHKGHIPSSTDYLQTGRTLFEDFDCGTCGSFLLHEKSQDGIEQLEVQINMQQMPRLDKFNEPPPNTPKKSTFCNHLQMQKPVFASSSNWWQASAESEVLAAEGFRSHGEESASSRLSMSSNFSKEKKSISTSQVFMQEARKMDKSTAHQSEPQKYQGIPIMEPIGLFNTSPPYEQPTFPRYHDNQLLGRKTANYLDSASTSEPICIAKAPEKQPNPYGKQVSGVPKTKGNIVNVEEAISFLDKQTQSDHNSHEPTVEGKINSSDRVTTEANQYYVKTRKGKAGGVKRDAMDWDSLRKKVQFNNGKKERSNDTMDSLDYEALNCASVSEISEAIKERGMNNMLAERIKDFLNRLVKEHRGIDLEWLRDVPPENAKDYLLSIRGLGLKSVECVRLLTLQHLAFPVDTNVGRIAVRLGWVPLQPLPESLQLHLLELYPVLESIQKYLWPRLCKLDQLTLYELHYQLITFGKVFCTKSRPNCNACPMRAECRHFASAFASARLALPGPEEKSLTTSTAPIPTERKQALVINNSTLPLAADTSHDIAGSCMPIVEEPATPEVEPIKEMESDIEDMFDQDPDEIPIIRLNVEELTATVQNYVQETMVLQEGDMSKALVVLNPNAASIPAPKLKNISRLRTEHQVYELPDSHPLLEGMERREPDDPSPYLLAIWTPGETSDSIQLPEHRCKSHEADKLCDQKTCFSCNSIREANSQTVRGTLLIPCRTAMRGSFPLNGTYFQVNEMFADHESSLHPIDVPRAWIWNLPRRMVYFGTSVSSIFKGLATQEIQLCFWKGFVCVRGFELKTRAPRPLVARLHLPASKSAKAKNEKTSIRT